MVTATHPAYLLRANVSNVTFPSKLATDIFLDTWYKSTKSPIILWI